VTKYSRTNTQFEFIELVLAYEGLLTNQRLRERFGITSVQASRILAAYRQAHADNMVLLTGEGRGRYGPTSRFAPAAAVLSIHRYFEVAAESSAHIDIEDVHQDLTQVDPGKFRLLHAAMAAGGAVEVVYRSMSHPRGLSRVLHPRAFVFAGRRWHVRAFDEHTGEYRDFNLARMHQAESADSRFETPPDAEWEEQVNLLLVPHPLLDPDQGQLIRDELFRGAAGRRLKTRRALVRYVLKELEVAEDPDVQRPPDYQICLQSVE
jgi:predicted DNA-binding transcriptional regulator YafY